jgi:hypothetical protein
MEICSRALLPLTGKVKPHNKEAHTGFIKYVYPIIRIMTYSGQGLANVTGYVMEAALSNTGDNKFTFQLDISDGVEPDDFQDKMKAQGFSDGVFMTCDLPNELIGDEDLLQLTNAALVNLLSDDFPSDWGFDVQYNPIYHETKPKKTI